MAKLLKLRRGTDTQHASFTTGEIGEITVNTTNNSIHVHDGGTTTGGTELARADLSNVSGTTEGSINVTGTVTCDGLTCDGTSVFSGSNPVIDIQDTNSTGGSNSTSFVRGKDQNGTVLWYVGEGSSARDALILYAAAGNVELTAAGTKRAEVTSTAFVPGADDTYDLGTSSLQWRNAWFDGTVNCDAFSCPTTVTAGSYGSASAIPNFTVDSSGRLTAAGSSALNNASETVSGIVELATAAETTTGTATNRAVHPAGLKVELDKKLDSDISSLPTLP